MYKVGTFVRFKSKWPAIHLNTMFGHSDLDEKDIRETEHIGVIRSVSSDLIFGPWYNVFTVHPLAGVTCHIRECDVLQTVKDEELSEEELSWRSSIFL